MPPLDPRVVAFLIRLAVFCVAELLIAFFL
jgi:hypothetical protein